MRTRSKTEKHVGITKAEVQPAFRRDYYNPIRGLSLPRLVAMEDQAERGQFADIQWFYHHMAKADVTIIAAMERRLSFLKGMFGDWRFNAESRSHEPEGQAIDRKNFCILEAPARMARS